MLETIRNYRRSMVLNLAALVLALGAIATVACSSAEDPTPIPEPTATQAPEPTATPVPEPTATQAPALPSGFERFTEVPGIVDATNFDWPRSIETSIGRIDIAAAPERLYSLSLGHAEIVAALRGGDVLVATASFFKDPGTSASYMEFVGSPDAGRDPEEIISLDPEIVIASAFTSADLIEQLNDLGIDVVKADLEDSALGNVPNILLLGYMLGEEERAIELADEVTARVELVSGRVDSAAPEKPRVLAMSRYSDIFVAGSGSTEGGIIETAGAVNAAAADGVEGHQSTGIEGIAAMAPDIILLTQPEESALEFAEELYADPALADIPAVRNRNIHFGDPTFFTTLSHWNVRGIEESAKLFYPELFEGETFLPFTHP